MLCYCKKCGRVVQEVYGRDKQICDYCNGILEYIPKQFLIGKRGIALNDDLKQQAKELWLEGKKWVGQCLLSCLVLRAAKLVKRISVIIVELLGRCFSPFLPLRPGEIRALFYFFP